MATPILSRFTEKELAEDLAGGGTATLENNKTMDNTNNENMDDEGRMARAFNRSYKELS